MPGVKVVRDGDFVGVTAPDPETAEKALMALTAEWKQLTAEASSQRYGRLFPQDRPRRARAQSEPDHLHHRLHRPRAARTARGGGRMGGRQAHRLDRLAASLRRAQRAFRHSSSCRKTACASSCPTPAPATAASTPAMPPSKRRVWPRPPANRSKRNWTREEEMTWAYFRPGGVIDVGAKVNPDGTIAEWEFHNYNSGPSAMQSPYAIAERSEQYHPCKTPLRQGSYRGLAATANHFARESYMDELAHSAGHGPARIPPEERPGRAPARVIQAAAGKFGWKERRKTAGRGFGIAAGFEKGGYVATCAEVSVTNGVVKVRARGGRVRMRRHRQSRAPAQPGGRRGRHGHRRRAVRADRIRRQPILPTRACRATACRASPICR